jgi:pyruvate/2-oxoglutarate dehydrogenase complex dihydrolipoamide acyltransferase (E2) component
MAWALDEERVAGTGPFVFASVLAGQALTGETYEPSAFGLADDTEMAAAVAQFDLPFVKTTGSGRVEQPAVAGKAESRTSTGEVAPPPQPDGDLTRAALDRAADLQADGASALEATESAKALADELGVDLATVTGTGKDGRVTRDDVQAAAAALVTAPEQPSEGG